MKIIAQLKSVLCFIGTFIKITLAVCGVGTLGVVFLGWKPSVPISWIWLAISTIASFIVFETLNPPLWKVIVFGLTWFPALLLVPAIIFGFGLAIYECKNKSSI